jgi:hypothetical protein
MTSRLLTLSVIAVSAVTASLSGAQAPRAQDRSVPTFANDVAPIVYAKCAACHRPGEVAPMSLLTYRDVRPWASAIREKVMTRAMPPWHADRQYGRFRNDTSLTQAEIDTLVAWVDGGAREGDPAALPALPKFPDGWQIGTPDAVFEMATAYDVPARGEIEYQYFEVPTNFTEDKWMQAGEVRAGDRAHVHHIIVYVREPQPVRRPTVMTVRAIPNPSGAAAPARPAPAPRAPAAAEAGRPAAAAPRTAARPGGGDAMLVNWAVGEDAPVHMPGTAKRIPAGSTLIFQVHYTTNGTPGQDRSKIGLIFAKEPPRREVRTGLVANATFAIPPAAANHQVEAEATFLGRRPVVDAPAHAPARQGHDLHGDLSRRPPRDRAARAEVRLRLADRLLARRAAQAAEGIEAACERALRQLPRQSREPRSGRHRALGRSDVGRDDDRVLHVYGRFASARGVGAVNARGRLSGGPPPAHTGTGRSCSG